MFFFTQINEIIFLGMFWFLLIYLESNMFVSELHRSAVKVTLS